MTHNQINIKSWINTVGTPDFKFTCPQRMSPRPYLTSGVELRTTFRRSADSEKQYILLCPPYSNLYCKESVNMFYKAIRYLYIFCMLFNHFPELT